MSVPRSVSLAALVLIGTLWAGVVTELGLWVLIDGPPVVLPRYVRILAGLGIIGAGLLIFMVIVADRLFPSVGRRNSMWGVEMAMMVIFLGGLAMLPVFYGGF